MSPSRLRATMRQQRSSSFWRQGRSADEQLAELLRDHRARSRQPEEPHGDLLRVQDRNRDEGGTTGREGSARDGGFPSQATVEHRQLCGGKRIGLRCLMEAEEKFQAGLLQLAAQRLVRFGPWQMREEMSQLRHRVHPPQVLQGVWVLIMVFRDHHNHRSILFLQCVVLGVLGLAMTYDHGRKGILGKNPK